MDIFKVIGSATYGDILCREGNDRFCPNYQITLTEKYLSEQLIWDDGSHNCSINSVDWYIMSKDKVKIVVDNKVKWISRSSARTLNLID